MANDPIRHVVVLMLENRSFDQMLGAMQRVFPDCDGVPAAAPSRVNQDSTGRSYTPRPDAMRIVDPDPEHDLDNVRRQMEAGMSGFVRDYERAHKRTLTQQRQQVMSYFDLDALRPIHTLARQYCICDHWFSSVPGPTWTNRFFIHSGTSMGRVKMPGLVTFFRAFGYTQTTLYDRLNAAGRTWRIYYDDIPQSYVLKNQRSHQNSQHYERQDAFYAAARGPAKEFPDYVFIEPSYFGGDQNDDHPPSDTHMAQALLARVYNALRSNEALWKTTLFVLCYDEHGGFYDHVEPGDAVPPDGKRDEWTFDRYGVRVPALLMSPWVDARVEHTLFDHTSVIRYLSEKWSLGPLGDRVGTANSIGVAIRTEGEPRMVLPYVQAMPSLDLAAAMYFTGRTPDSLSLNANQRELEAFSEYLAGEAGMKEHSMAWARAFIRRGPIDAKAAIRDRFETHLAHAQADR